MCVLDDASKAAKLIFIAVGHHTITDSPLSELLPPSACYESIDIIPLTPYVVLLDIGLLLFSITNPLVDLVRYCFIAELGEPRCDG